MNLDIQRFSIPTGSSQVSASGVIQTLDPNPVGDWVRYDDVVAFLGKYSSARRYFKCLKRIEIPGTGGIAVTYCQLTVGHKGECQ